MTPPAKPAYKTTLKLYAGTSGFSYQEWKGRCCPEDLPANRMLGAYASRFPPVEINSVFYRIPKRSILEGLTDKGPETFRFAIKAPRRISHPKQPKDREEEAGYLFKPLERLGAEPGLAQRITGP